MSVEDDVDRIVLTTFFRGRRDGIMIEVGAARPDYLSISALFRREGWRIIAIEPNPDFCALHKEKGYDVLQYACGTEDRDGVEFTIVDSQGVDYLGGKVTAESFSSLGIKDEFRDLMKNVEGRITTKKILVKLRRLDTILAEHATEVQKVDAVCIDVEGWELAVLDGFSLDRYAPDVVVLENIFRKPEYANHMNAHGYARWIGLGLNEVYVRESLMTPRAKIAAMNTKAQYRLNSIRKRVARLLLPSK